MRSLEAIIVAACQNMGAATGFSAFVRLEGAGLPQGPEVIGVLAGGAQVATGGNASVPAKKIPIGVPVTPTQEILIFGEMAGTDVGQVSIGVTLVFSP